jgi:hypothetical protein
LEDYSTQDPALAPIRRDIPPFLSCLRGLISQGNAQGGEANAEALVERAIDHVTANGD